MLTVMDIDFTSIGSAGCRRLVLNDNGATIYMLEQDLYDYIAKFGYNASSLDKFFETKGWEYHYEITKTDLGPFQLHILLKIIIELLIILE